MRRVKIIEANSCASQRDSLEYLSKSDAYDNVFSKPMSLGMG